MVWGKCGATSFSFDQTQKSCRALTIRPQHMREHKNELSGRMNFVPHTKTAFPLCSVSLARERNVKKQPLAGVRLGCFVCLKYFLAVLHQIPEYKSMNKICKDLKTKGSQMELPFPENVSAWFSGILPFPPTPMLQLSSFRSSPQSLEGGEEIGIVPFHLSFSSISVDQIPFSPCTLLPRMVSNQI